MGLSSACPLNLSVLKFLFSTLHSPHSTPFPFTSIPQVLVQLFWISPPGPGPLALTLTMANTALIHPTPSGLQQWAVPSARQSDSESLLHPPLFLVPPSPPPPSLTNTQIHPRFSVPLPHPCCKPSSLLPWITSPNWSSCSQSYLPCLSPLHATQHSATSYFHLHHLTGVVPSPKIFNSPSHLPTELLFYPLDNCLGDTSSKKSSWMPQS